MNESRRALFLDRDGVINADHGYVGRIEDFDFTPGIFDLVRIAVNELKLLAIVITNQSGIGRGLFDEAAFARLTAWMREQFERRGAPLTAVYHCPYHPEHGVGEYRRDHPWRKPNPGMILQAAADHRLDLARSALIGDGERDIIAGAAAGVGLLIRFDPEGSETPGLPKHELVRDLGEAAAVLRRCACVL